MSSKLKPDSDPDSTKVAHYARAEEPPAYPENVGYPTETQNIGGPNQPQKGVAYPSPVQPGYPILQPSDPTPNQAGCFPPPQQSPCPPRQQPYPDQQPEQPLSQHKDTPPTYDEATMVPPQPQQQKTSTNVVIIQQQPTASMHTTTVRPVKDNYLILSVVLTVICFSCCLWFCLACTISALILSIDARNAEKRGDTAKARSYSRISLGLNITAIVSWTLLVVGAIVSNTAQAASGRYNYRYQHVYSFTDSYCYSSGCYYYTSYAAYYK